MPLDAYRRLEEIFETVFLLKRTLSLLHWDSAVMMPEAAAAARGRQMAAQTSALHRTLTAPEIPRLLDTAEGTADGLGPWVRANLREMRRLHRLHTAVPEDLQARLTDQAVTTELAWRRARKAGDFEAFGTAFAPLLDLLRRKAECMGKAFGVTPYEGLMREYDPQANQSNLDGLFAPLAERLPPLVRRIVERQERTGGPTLEPPAIAKAQQRKLCRRVLTDLGFDFARGRLDESTHPFTEGAGPDVRMTVRYDVRAPINGLMAAMHECGHALYDQQLPGEWALQPVGQDRGMTVHESIALFYEMVLGRTPAFARHLSACLADLGIAWDVHALHQALTRVHPGPIRTEADEVSYIPHIILRTEHEMRLLDGTLSIRDLRDSWSARMAELLGVEPRTHAEGVLQDIHWSLGLFGYFPCYAKGLILATAHFRRYTAEIETLDFAGLLARLDSDIFARGSLEPSLALVDEVFADPRAAETVLAFFAERHGIGPEARGAPAREGAPG